MTKIFNLLDTQDDIFSAAAETGATLINGLGGADSITGGKGNDTINAGQGNDTIYGGANGADLLIGEAGNDRLVATSSANGGSSTMMGGAGDDTYVVGLGQTFSIVEKAGEGFDTMRVAMRDHGHTFTMPDHVEQAIIETVIPTDSAGGMYEADYRPPSFFNGNAQDNVIHGNYLHINRIWAGAGNDIVHGGNADDRLGGEGGHDKLLGGAGADGLWGDDSTVLGQYGNDTLDGGAGADTMWGGKGDDTYHVDNAGDLVGEDAGAGTDAVVTTLSFHTLSANVETLSYGGTGVFEGMGNALANLISGGNANDTLVGMDGADKLYGGFGNDQLYGGAHNDRLSGEAGNDILSGQSGADTLSGHGGNDTLDGGTLHDQLDGGSGADSLFGAAGDDVLNGGTGNDTLQGDWGADDLTGGAGSDRFRFAKVTDSPAGGTLDAILDFQKGYDRIDLSAMDANATIAGNQTFGFAQAQPFFHGPGDLWLQVTGADTYVHADVNGDGAKDFSLFVQGVTGLTASDFIL
jgi:Ca2+-binding RTX toxin-like protein